MTNFPNYLSLISESLSSRIELLSNILDDKHWPSIGTYKEKLLLNTIKQFLPEKFGITSGFVCFNSPPIINREKTPFSGGAFLSDYLISKQCDIIIYDRLNYPIIYNDDGFAIVWAQSVKVIIEVKSTLNFNNLSQILEGQWDFQMKWNEYVKLVQRYGFIQDVKPTIPLYFGFCWKSNNRNGKHIPSQENVINKICKYYSDKLTFNNANTFWPLNKLYSYNSFFVSQTFYSDINNENGFGYLLEIGRRYHNEIGYDRTIFDLLNLITIHLCNYEMDNMILPFQEQASKQDLDQCQKSNKIKAIITDKSKYWDSFQKKHISK